MATVNVNRSMNDQFYRYKMPKIIAKVEGKGNGIKTVIVNMVEVAKSLNRPPMYPTKYFGCVLGAQVNCDLKNERYIVNGSHDSNRLQDLLDGFITKYVLCASCGNPETVLGVLVKKQVITTSCKACGHSGTIPSTDKLTTYIIKCPPVQVKPANGTIVADGKKPKGRKDGKKNGQTNGGSPQHDSDENGDAVNGIGQNNDDDDDWGEDTNADAVAKRLEELSAGAKSLMLNADLEKTQEERLQLFFDVVKKKNETCKGVFDLNAQKDIVGEADRLDVRDKAVIALCELLFDAKMLTQIKQQRILFLRFTNENVKAQKYLMRGIELTIKTYEKDLIPKTAHILKAFYDNDIIDEKVILDWASKAYKKTVGKEMAQEIHSKAAPFVKWLKEADVDSEESEGDEEELDVVYDDRVNGTKIENVNDISPVKDIKAPLLAPAAADDFDIDAI
ncbi:Eukaryotic translation initiation factor 5 [Halotydeus destructor]|nr:Eukaryotic translation initiation factor 5 [Halotydeus destructor]